MNRLSVCVRKEIGCKFDGALDRDFVQNTLHLQKNLGFKLFLYGVASPSVGTLQFLAIFDHLHKIHTESLLTTIFCLSFVMSTIVLRLLFCNTITVDLTEHRQ